MTNTEVLLLALAVIFAVPFLVWRLTWIGRIAPLVVVQIVSGILLGPGVLGAMFPSLFSALFGSAVIASLNSLASWAVILFVWVAGLELELHQLWAARRETCLTASLALALPLVLGAGAATLLIQSPGWMGEHAHGWQAALGIGMACAVTALPILVLLMDDFGILHAPLGRRILRYASVDDLAIWIVLAIILLDGGRAFRQLVFLTALAPMVLGIRWLMPRLSSADRWYVAMIWLILCAWGADWSGLHYMVGAFVAGAALDANWFGQEAIETLRRNVLVILMPIFFLSTGLRTSWSGGGLMIFAGAALLLVAAVAGKLIGVGIAGRLLGWPKGEGLLIGWLLQTKALIMIIFANILLDKGIIQGGAFTALLLMAVASTMLTTPMARPILRRLQS